MPIEQAVEVIADYLSNATDQASEAVHHVAADAAETVSNNVPHAADALQFGSSHEWVDGAHSGFLYERIIGVIERIIGVIDVAERQGPERVSVSSAGQQGNGFSSLPSISADGRFVAYQSNASNLVEGDNNETADIFVITTHDFLFV
jgi:hypothetical protein